MAWVRIQSLASLVVWVFCWCSSLFQRYLSRLVVFPPSEDKLLMRISYGRFGWRSISWIYHFPILFVCVKEVLILQDQGGYCTISFHYSVILLNEVTRMRKICHGITLWNRAKIRSNKYATINDPNFDFFFVFLGLTFKVTNFKARQLFLLVTKRALMVLSVA